MADQNKQAGETQGPGLWGIPLGAIAATSLIVPAFASFLLLRSGIAHRSGGAIAIGAIVGAFWLMLLVQTARSAVGPAAKLGD